MTGATLTASPAHDVSEARPGNKRQSRKSAPKKPERRKRVAITENALATYLSKLADGYSRKAAARAAGHDARVLRRYLNRPENEELRLLCVEAYDDGTDEYEDWLRNAAESGNVTAQIFALKNRRPQVWRDRHEVTHQIPAGDVQRLLAQLGEFVPADRREQFLAELEAMSGGSGS